MVMIPKILGHIWVGHLPAPTEWMDSWKKFHPDWEYRLYDNEYLFSRRWHNQHLINAFYRRGEYAGVSDLMRYEILMETGGFIPEADSICQRTTNELWTKQALYTVYENEEKKPGFVSPFLASAPQHEYLKFVNNRLWKSVSPETLEPAWRSVGNRFLRNCMNRLPPENLKHDKVVIFPSHYFIPNHKDVGAYEGDGPVYCDQLWGSTLSRYGKAQDIDVDAVRAKHMQILEENLTSQRS